MNRSTREEKNVPWPDSAPSFRLEKAPVGFAGGWGAFPNRKDYAPISFIPPSGEHHDQ